MLLDASIERVKELLVRKPNEVMSQHRRKFNGRAPNGLIGFQANPLCALNNGLAFRLLENVVDHERAGNAGNVVSYWLTRTFCGRGERECSGRRVVDDGWVFVGRSTVFA